MISTSFINLSTSEFNFHKDLKELTTELSALTYKPNGSKREQVSVGSSLTIIGKITGKIVVFKLASTCMDDSGEDIYGWIYKPVKPHLCPNIKQVIIFND